MRKMNKDVKDILLSFLQKSNQGASLKGSAPDYQKKLRINIFSIFKNL
ncbi:MAG: hypothetical protein HBSAPP04_01150 [Ignavibacteriaceae bacterium]|nr:MAG: hypothetical protein HBSAPP04_01150 [Ignavibacteriaceae bacterium]